MATLAIESNGLLEKTAVYYNGQQISGIKELFINLDETGTFDAVIQYEGVDKNLYVKQIFEDYLENVRTSEPSFTEEESMELTLLQIESEGDIDSSAVFIDDLDFPQEGVVSLFVHIKPAPKESGIRSLFNKDKPHEASVFKAEITYRNEDDSTDTEVIF